MDSGRDQGVDRAQGTLPSSRFRIHLRPCRHRPSPYQTQASLDQRPGRTNRTIKEATVKRFYYETHDQLRSHLADFVTAYNFAKRLKTLKGLTPYEYICKLWTKEPDRFTLNPLQKMPGLNT